MTFARSGQEALSLLRENPQDIVISDLQLPDIPDATEAQDGKPLWPSMVRVVLSGQSDEGATLRAIGSAKPSGACEPSTLRSLVQRTIALQRLCANERMRVVVASMDTLPSAPMLFRELNAELARESCSLVQVGEIISEDVAMTAKILRIVNSAYFGFRTTISDPTLAARFLGVRNLSSLVLACHIFQQADPQATAGLGLDEVWSHSLETSRLARRIAESETTDRDLIDDSLAAGMLHDTGRILLAINFPGMVREMLAHSLASGESLLGLERSSFGVTHAEVGAYLMGVWGLRPTIVEAIAYHHNPEECVHHGFAPLTAVHAACSFLKESCESGGDETPGAPNADYIESAKLSNRTESWRGLQAEEAA